MQHCTQFRTISALQGVCHVSCSATVPVPHKQGPHRRGSAVTTAVSQSEDVSQLLREALSTTRSEATVNQRENMEYLRSVGYTNMEELYRILDIATNPFSSYRMHKTRKGKGSMPQARHLSVDHDIKPVVEFLQRQNIEPQRILKIISSHPPILCYGVEDHLEPLLASLKEAGLQDPVQTIAKRPSLLGLKPDASLARILGYLQDTGKTQEEIAALLERSL